MVNNIIIIGAGQIGSRHLQALKTVNTPLNIIVVDALESSLKTARERYESMSGDNIEHEINFYQKLPTDVKKIDMAIIATSSNARAVVTMQLLKQAKVKFLILEKILFQKPQDYSTIGNLITKTKTKVWINCCMRMMPTYKNLANEFSKQKISYRVTGNQSGLATDLIHHVDYMAHLTRSSDFKIDVRDLDKKLIPSKRAGFSEITGRLTVKFENGSHGIFECSPGNSIPKIIEIFNDDKRYIIRESEGKAFMSRAPDWQWEEIDTPLSYQSQLTNRLAEELFSTGKCSLPTYKESVKLHLATFEPIRKYFKLKSYPFT